MRKFTILLVVLLTLLVACQDTGDLEADHHHGDDDHHGMDHHDDTDHGGHMEHNPMPGITLTPVDRSVNGLQEAEGRSLITPGNGELVQLDLEIVKKEINGFPIRMFGYNGEIPGPLINVRQGDHIWLNVTNNIDMDSTVHSHGIRIDNQYDGVSGVTQPPIGPGETFLYRIDFPDAGMYWYHPHIREDYQQELGLYGNYWVIPSESEENPVNREEVLMLDDILIDGSRDVPAFNEEVINHALMGRFGNVVLVNGQSDPYSLSVQKGEVVRFYLTNVANVRPFKLSVTDAVMKVVGSDLGHYERDFLAEDLIIAPAERYIVEVRFDTPGISYLRHSTHHGSDILGVITVLDEPVAEDHGEAFDTLRTYTVTEEIDPFRVHLEREADIRWQLKVDMGTHDMGGMGMMVHADEDDIEYEDTMYMMNAMMDSANTEWQIVDMDTGKTNMDLDYSFAMGDLVKLHIENPKESMHPMQHPMHFHGQRFLVLTEDGVPNENMVWKDTVLIPIGHTVDILLEISNPGEWMAHCHIAEHLHSGMMAMFSVES